MRYGMNLLLWTDALSDEHLPLLGDIATIGYDAVDLPLFNENTETAKAWGERIASLGLSGVGITARNELDNPISSDPDVRRRGLDANKNAVDCCQAAGIKLLCGPFHSALGHFTGIPATDDEWKWAIDSARELSEYADQADVSLGVEYLNRFECYLLTSAADVDRFCREVDHVRCGAMFDTFHAHIEEKENRNAIRALGDRLLHVHISENDRSTPGQGSVHWDQIFDALHELGYDRTISVEAFGPALEHLLPATKIWRRMYDSETQLAGDALQFMKREVEKRRH